MLEGQLNRGVFVPHWSLTDAEFLAWTGQNRHRIDCLILEQDDRLGDILDHLKMRGILLPAIVISLPPGDHPSLFSGESLSNGDPAILESVQSGGLSACLDVGSVYHSAVACLGLDDLNQIERYLHQAIDQFLRLPPSPAVNEYPDFPTPEDTQRYVLSLQQERLTEKLNERLGYLGVYYKRNPENFFRNMSQAEREELVQKLRSDYRIIILNYFSKDPNLNQKIDDFVNVAFFADISVSQIVEIHMELMDEFSKQLKLEGRSEEILLDYRLTLIDVIAHLCEMYRRSIPREM